MYPLLGNEEVNWRDIHAAHMMKCADESDVQTLWQVRSASSSSSTSGRSDSFRAIGEIYKRMVYGWSTQVSLAHSLAISSHALGARRCIHPSSRSSRCLPIDHCVLVALESTSRSGEEHRCHFIRTAEKWLAAESRVRS